MRISLICCIVLLMSACGGGGESERETTLLQDQTEILNKAKDVENVIGDASIQQHQRIDEQMQ